jgi:hypothetical protein
MSEEKSRVALTVQVGEQKRDITFDELTLSNNFAIEALVKLLIEKKVFDIKELQDAMNIIRKERYLDPDPPKVS